MTSDKFAQLWKEHPSLLTGMGEEGVPLSGKTRSESAVHVIESYILREGLHPGDPLPTEGELCAMLGVSRSSVREAIRTLRALDVVTTVQGKGNFVSDMSLDGFVETLVMRSLIGVGGKEKTLMDVVAMRKYLDLGSAGEVVAAMGGTTHPELHATVDAMIKKADAGEEYLDEDIAFHSQLTQMLDNAIAHEIVNAMWIAHMAGVRPIGALERGELLEAAFAHKTMLDVAEEGNVLGYQGAVIAHYRPIERHLRRVTYKK